MLHFDGVFDSVIKFNLFIQITGIIFWCAMIMIIQFKIKICIFSNQIKINIFQCFFLYKLYIVPYVNFDIFVVIYLSVYIQENNCGSFCKYLKVFGNNQSCSTYGEINQIHQNRLFYKIDKNYDDNKNILQPKYFVCKKTTIYQFLFV